jgi:7 transmembrane receptor (Secretin family).
MIITFLTHFVWILVFTWTGKIVTLVIQVENLTQVTIFSALEGFFLYKALVVVFDSGEDHFRFIYIVSYGVSAIIVVTTLVVSFIRDDFYFREDACWLNDSYIWAFKGPVLVIVILNMVVLVVGLRAAYMVRNSNVFEMSMVCLKTILSKLLLGQQTQTSFEYAESQWMVAKFRDSKQLVGNHLDNWVLQ